MGRWRRRYGLAADDDGRPAAAVVQTAALPGAQHRCNLDRRTGSFWAGRGEMQSLSVSPLWRNRREPKTRTKISQGKREWKEKKKRKGKAMDQLCGQRQDNRRQAKTAKAGTEHTLLGSTGDRLSAARPETAEWGLPVRPGWVEKLFSPPSCLPAPRHNRHDELGGQQQ